MRRFGFLPENMNFLFLVPLAAGVGGDKPMSEADIRSAFVGNTVVMESPEGSTYDLVQPDGSQLGLHPKHGKLKGNWQIDKTGEVCVTWQYSTGFIKNCSKVVDLGNDSYQWGDQKLTLQHGDIKQLGK